MNKDNHKLSTNNPEAAIQVLEEGLVTASSPCADEFANTGIFIRNVHKQTNLDFLFLFDGPLKDVKRLKESLRELLTQYPTLAGRIHADQVRIHLNNQGAFFKVQSISNRRLQDIPQEPAIGPPYCHIPTPSRQVQGEDPLLTVTVTHLQDGWTLGVVISHLVADAWTIGMVLKDWSDLYHHKTIEAVQYQLPNVILETYATTKESDDAAFTLLNSVRAPWGKRLLFKTLFQSLLPRIMANDPRIGTTPERLILHYTQPQLKTIKQRAEVKAESWVSSNEALLAHVWQLLLDAAQIKTPPKGASLAVNLRAKLPGVSRRLAGNVASSVYFALNDTDTPLERQVHDGVRSVVQPDILAAFHKIGNALWLEKSEFVLYQHKAAGDLLLGGIPGCLGWNWQVTNPYFEIDFGSGKPVRGIPWCWSQPITVLASPRGGVDVYIEKKERGPDTWKQPPPKWNTIRNACALAFVATSVAVWKTESKRSTSFFWLASLGALAVGANRLASRDAVQSKQEFFDYVKENAHRGTRK